MCQHDNRRAVGKRRDIALDPFQLFVAELRETGGFEAGLEVEYIGERDEMNAGGIEAVPAPSLCFLAVAREIGLAVIDIGNVMLARDIEYLLVRPFDDLVGGVPLLLLGQMADI